MLDFAPAPLQEIALPLLVAADVRVFVKREDLVHPQLQGNKWRKLKYHISAMRNDNQNTILTYGGAFSNHIYATAAAAQLLDFQAIGVIRGERTEPLNATLQFAETNGMLLHFVSRSDYRLRGTPEFTIALRQQLGDFYELPEGGSGDCAVQGVAELADELLLDLPDADFVAVAAGTGATAAGLAVGFGGRAKVLAFSVLKGGDFLTADIRNFIAQHNKKNAITSAIASDFDLFTDYHFGGYAKQNAVLRDFIIDFSTKTSIPIEHVYTAKMFYGLFDLVEHGYFPKGTKIIAVHTGGLR